MWPLTSDVSPRCDRVQGYSWSCVWVCSPVTWQHRGHGPWKSPGLSFILISTWAPPVSILQWCTMSPSWPRCAFSVSYHAGSLCLKFSLASFLPEEFLLYRNVSVKPCLLGWLPWLDTLVKYLFSLWVLSLLSDPEELTIRCGQRSGGMGGHLRVYITCWYGLGEVVCEKAIAWVCRGAGCTDSSLCL